MPVIITNEELDSFNKNGFTDDDVRATIDKYRSQGLDDKAIRQKVDDRLNEWKIPQTVTQQPTQQPTNKVVEEQPEQEPIKANIKQNVIPNWDKKGRIYYTDEQGNKIDFDVPLSRKIGNKIKATVTNLGSFLTDTYGQNYKDRQKLGAMLATAPIGFGGGIGGMALGGALGGGLYSAAEQYIDTGKVDPKQTLKDTAFGGAFGGALGAGGKYIASPVIKNITRRADIAKRRGMPLIERISEPTLKTEAKIMPEATTLDDVAETTPLNIVKNVEPQANSYEEAMQKLKENPEIINNENFYNNVDKMTEQQKADFFEAVEKAEDLNEIKKTVNASEKINLNTLKQNIRNNKFIESNLNNSLLKTKGKKGYRTIIADPISYDMENSQREFNKIITEISKNPSKLNDENYISELENRVEKIVDRTPFGDKEEVATPYWNKFWQAIEDGGSYNDFKANKGKKVTKNVEPITEQVIEEAPKPITEQNIEQMQEQKNVPDLSTKNKERNFVNTIRKKYGDDIANQINDADYEVYQHKMQQANWENRTPEQKAQALNEIDNINPDVLYGKAQALNQAIKNGEPINSTILDGIARNLTKAGQEIEATKHFVPSSPEGIALETVKQTRKNTPEHVLKLKDEAAKIVDEVKKQDMSNAEAEAKFNKWLNTQIEEIKQKPVYGEKLALLKAMENYRVKKANAALKASERRMAKEEFLNTDYSNQEAEERFLHSLSKDKRPPKEKTARGTKEALLKAMENYRKREAKRLAREENKAISIFKKQEIAKQKALEKEELAAIKALQKEEKQRLKNIENILSKRIVKKREQKNLATQLLALNDNNGLTPENFARLVDRHYDIKNIDVNDYPKIQELSKKFINAKTDRERAIANGLIKKFIWEKQPKAWADKDRTYRTINMLLSLPSRGLDLASTAIFQGIKAGDELIAKGLDKITGQGLRGGVETLNPVPWFKNLKRGAKEGLEDVNLGIDTARSGEVDRYELGFHPVFENTPILGGAEKITNATIRVPDRAFYEGAYNSALNDLISTGKFTEEEAKEIAKDEAKQAVLQGNGILSSSSKAMRDLLNARINGKPLLSNEEAQKVVDIIQLGNREAPFAMTPANLAAEGLEHSPFGLVKGGLENFFASTPAQKRRAQLTLAKGLGGTTITTLGGGYVLNQIPNNIGGFSNEDIYGDDVRNLQPQSVVIGDKAVSLAGAPFITIPMAIGKALLQPNATMPERLLNTAIYTGNVLVDLPMIKSIGDLSKGIVDIADVAYDVANKKADLKDVEQAIGRTIGQQASNIISQNIPFSGTLGTLRTAFDPYNREMMTYNDNALLGTAEYIGNRILNRIPFASKMLPMKYNVLGEPSMRTNIENPVLSFLEATASPVRVRNYKERPPEMIEMQRLQDYAKDNNIKGQNALKFAKPKRYLGSGKNKVRLNNREYSEFTRLYNGKIYDELQFLMNTPEYQQTDDETKIKWVKEVLKEKKEEAEQEIYDMIKNKR